MGSITRRISPLYNFALYQKLIYTGNILEKEIIDYDWKSAYTTVMAFSGDPLYEYGRIISFEDLKLKSDKDILYSYIIMKVKFKFNENVRYPSIPCYVDENTMIFPLSGEAVIMGSKYLLL